MKTVTRRAIALAFCLLLAACATTPQYSYNWRGEADAIRRKSDYMGEISFLSRVLGGTLSAEERGAVLIRRGIAYREAAYRLAGAKDAQDSSFIEKYGLYVNAMADFDEVIQTQPNPGQTAEAIYNMGLTYDYPYDLNKFDIAIGYYRDAIARFPDSEFARQSQDRLNLLIDIMQKMKTGSPGTRGGMPAGLPSGHPSMDQMMAPPTPEPTPAP